MRLILRFIPMTATMAVIFFLSHQPYGVVELSQFAGADKLAHAFIYGILAASVLFALRPFGSEAQRIRTAMLVLLFCLLYGASDEFHQSFIPGRLVSAWDLAADFLGALVVVLYWYLKTGRHEAGKYS